MTTNYSNKPIAIKNRAAYWMHHDRICEANRERYAADAAYRDARIQSAKTYRANNIEYVRKLDSIRNALAYAIKHDDFERAQQLLVEKRLHQMTKPNRRKPMTQVRTVR